MNRSLRGLVAFPLAIALAFIATGTKASRSASPIASTRVPTISEATAPKTVLIMDENKRYTDIIGNSSAPYINSLANKYRTFTHFYGAQHYSLYDYLDVTAGDNPANHGQKCDVPPKSCNDTYTNIVDQLENAGLTWKEYVQDYTTPGKCDVDTIQKTPYESDHVPFLWYTDIRSDPTRCARIVGRDQLVKDVSNNALPTFSLITPNQYTDMHNVCTTGPCPPGSPDKVLQGDYFLKYWVPKLMAVIGTGGRIIITWDESVPGDTQGCCQLANGGHLAALVVGPGVTHQVVAGNYDTYSILAAIEKRYGFPLLRNAGCSCTTPMPL